MSLLNSLKRRVLGLSPDEASFARRGFPALNSPSRAHLESVIRTFIEGYNLALVTPDGKQLAAKLDAGFTPEFVGFAYEGAGLYFGLMDLMLPQRSSRLAAFAAADGAPQDFIMTVGAGLAFARVPFAARRLQSYQRKLDPMSAWCLADGYGFHEGFFHWKKYIEKRQAAPAFLDLQGRRLFDAGVGRTMWWVYGADSSSISTAIARFEPDRRPEMWTGIGTALAYAGAGPHVSSEPGSHIEDSRFFDLLPQFAGEYRHDLLSGIPFAAHMRHKGGNASAWTERVCANLLGMSVAETSSLITSELTEYLATWQGAEQEKWDNCYLALRERVKGRLQDLHHNLVPSFAVSKEMR